MTETFTCAHCGWTGEKGWSDEEAEAEAAQNFGDLEPDDRVLICDDCYRVMVKLADWRRR